MQTSSHDQRPDAGAEARTVYKILSTTEWRIAQEAGEFRGSAVDYQDGYIHLSTAAQVGETARRHFSKRTDLVLLAIDVGRLDDLRFEPSRGGDLFPHLYAALPVAAVRWAKPLVCKGDQHIFPELDR